MKELSAKLLADLPPATKACPDTFRVSDGQDRFHYDHTNEKLRQGVKDNAARLLVMATKSYSPKVTWWSYDGKVTSKKYPPLLCKFPQISDEKVSAIFGDLSTAYNVAISVPGVGSDVAEAFPSSGTISAWASNAKRLYDAMRVGSPDTRNAVLVWLRYNPPSSLTDAPSIDKAEAAGRLLHADVGSINQARRSKIHMTLVGHSYGSTVVGYSQMPGTSGRTDGYALDTVLVGSPGVGVYSMFDHWQTADTTIGSSSWIDGYSLAVINRGKIFSASDCRDNKFHHGDVYAAAGCFRYRNHIWTVYAPGDPVVVVGGLGTPPSMWQFGGNVRKVSNSSWPLAPDNHSHYFDAGSTSLNAISAVCVGRYSGATWEIGPFGKPADRTSTEELPVA